MSDFKFSCPACGQHLSADTSYIGRLITCPSCNQAITVPAALPPPPPPQLYTTARPSAPPPVSSVPAMAAAAPKTCGLALASLICSCAGVFLSLLGTMPGIVCGHLAIKQINRTRGLEGRGLARAGLITGYVLTVLWLAPIGFILFVAVASGFKAASQVQPGNRGTTTTVVWPRSEGIEEYGASARMDTKPDASGWTYDLADVAIPDAAVAGRLHGVAFKPDVIKLTEFGLKFEFSFKHPDFGNRFLEISFDELRSDNSTAALLSKQTLVVRSDDPEFIQSTSGTGFNKPSVQIQWFDDAKRRFITGIPTNYVMRLEFGELKGNALPGKIYLCLPDSMKTFLRGKFVARVENAFELAGSGLATRTKGANADAVPDDPAWTLDLANATIPDVSVTGRVHGLDFKVQQVTMEFGELKFVQGAGIFPDREIGVRTPEHDPAKLSGRTIQWPATEAGDNRSLPPMVRLEWKRPGESVPNHAFAREIAVRLEFGELKNNRLPGRIYLCVLDHDQGKSYVRGKFTATLAQTPGFPAQRPIPVPTNPPFMRPRR